MWADVAQSRIVAASAASLVLDLFDADGEAPSPADAGTYTVEVVNAAGTVVKAAGTSTTTPVANQRSVALTRADTASLGRLTAIWSQSGTVIATTQHDVVGGVYYTVPELRAVPGAALLDASKHPAADLIDDRTEVEYQFEAVTQRAFVPRFWTERIRSSYEHRLALSHPDLRRVVFARYTTDGATWTDIENVDRVQPDAGGVAVRQNTWWPSGLIEIGYEYGWDRPTPEIKRAALTAARFRRNQDQSGRDPRQTAIQDQFGTIQLATPGVRHWVTAIPEVDEVLLRPGIRWRRWGVA